MGDAGGLTVDRIAGRLRMLRMEPEWRRGARIRSAVGRWRELPRGVRSLFVTPRDPSYARALSAFLRAVRDRTPVAPDLEDGERSLAVVLAAEAAARDGDKVTVAIDHEWVPEGHYRWTVRRVGDCERVRDPSDEASYAMVRECDDLVVNGTRVGFQCKYLPEKKLVEKCPWFRRR